MNKEIAETITHKIDLLRVSATLSKEYQSRLDTLEEKAIILSNGDLLKGYNKSQINAQLKAIDDEINAIFNELGDDYEELQEDIADSENDFLMWLFGISVLSLGNLKDVVKNANADGFTAKQATQKQAFDLRYELSGTIRNAWITAVLNKKALDEKLLDTPDLIKKQFKKIKNRIGLTVTNTIDTVVENVRYQFIMHNKKMNTLIHISVLDNKTSAICTARNGCMWDKDTKDGINTILPFELPPLHPHCRSHIYGINADENTPNMVYRGEDWIKERTLDELQEQFGKQAGQLLYNGDITLNQAIDRYGLKRLTLKQINKDITNRLNDFSQLPDLIRYAVKNPQSKKWYEIGRVSTKNAKLIKQVAGVDTLGFKRKVFSDELRHEFNSHGNNKKEKARGQRAFVDSDFQILNDIVQNPDKIKKGGKWLGNPNTIEYTKTYDNETFVYLELITNNKKWKAVRPISLRIHHREK